MTGNQKTWSCPQCGEGFASKREMQGHVLARPIGHQRKLTTQEYIDRGYIECPECSTHRGVDKRGNVLNCGKCSDVFTQQRTPWNLFVSFS